MSNIFIVFHHIYLLINRAADIVTFITKDFSFAKILIISVVLSDFFRYSYDEFRKI